MQSRRGFFGVVATVVASVGLQSVGLAGVKVRTRTRVRLEFADAAQSIIRCVARSHRDLDKLADTVRDIVWTPARRSKAAESQVRLYMESYATGMRHKVISRREDGNFQLFFTSNVLLTGTTDIPEKLLAQDIVVYDECNNAVMRKFKTTTKRGRTTTREVTRIED